MSLHGSTSPATAAAQYAKHTEKLSLLPQDSRSEDRGPTNAAQAKFITPQDPVIETSDGGRLPTVPVAEAVELNRLKDEAQSPGSTNGKREPRNRVKGDEAEGIGGQRSPQSERAEAPLRTAVPPSRTHPLFPELPLYGPASFTRNLQCWTFRASSAVLSLAFLGVIVLGSAFTSTPLMLRHIGLRLTFRDPDARRPFYDEEKRRQKIRQQENKAWKQKQKRHQNFSSKRDDTEDIGQYSEYEPTEGGKDPLICDAAYYARRVGLDIEEYKVQTEDGFIIDLWHVYDPREYTPPSVEHRDCKRPEVFTRTSSNSTISQDSTEPSKSCNYESYRSRFKSGKARYPVLMIHGLLQSSGAYCTNDDESLAFFLCKSGYDVWLGNNRCGFKPVHKLLTYSDPRMWAWNIRQMGVLDLPAFVSRVLNETGFEKLGLVCHSQGTTQTFVALAKGQRPELGNKISVFCALAPAVYAGPLIGKMYFKFMRIISPEMFRMMFGIHAFIPFMMTMHSWLPGSLYGALGYRVFSFLFNWTDDRWDQGLRSRMFQFAPVYVSSECMRWWLGRECFARQRCILATRSENEEEDQEDKEENNYMHGDNDRTERPHSEAHHLGSLDRGKRAWYDEQAPPFALWVAGADELVDGRRLLRRFERGREPHVRIVHTKIIDDYEHLDVIWAIDCLDQVGKEMREVLWETAPARARKECLIPKGCEGIQL